MAVVLSARAGTMLSAEVRWWEPGRVNLIDSSDYVARLEIGRLSPRRTLLSAKEWVSQIPDEPEAPVVDPPPGTVLCRVSPGVWEIRLGKTITRSLPQVSQFELELTNVNDPEDVVGLVSGEIHITPEAVSAVASSSS